MKRHIGQTVGPSENFNAYYRIITIRRDFSMQYLHIDGARFFSGSPIYISWNVSGRQSVQINVFTVLS